MYIQLQMYSRKMNHSYEDFNYDSFKGILQNYYQLRKLGHPSYKTYKSGGPPNNPTFKSNIVLPNGKFFSAFGRTKKEAEKKLAYECCIELGLVYQNRRFVENSPNISNKNYQIRQTDIDINYNEWNERDNNHNNYDCNNNHNNSRINSNDYSYDDNSNDYSNDYSYDDNSNDYSNDRYSNDYGNRDYNCVKNCNDKSHEKKENIFFIDMENVTSEIEYFLEIPNSAFYGFASTNHSSVNMFQGRNMIINTVDSTLADAADTLFIMKFTGWYLNPNWNHDWKNCYLVSNDHFVHTIIDVVKSYPDRGLNIYCIGCYGDYETLQV